MRRLFGISLKYAGDCSEHTPPEKGYVPFCRSLRAQEVVGITAAGVASLRVWSAEIMGSIYALFKTVQSVAFIREQGRGGLLSASVNSWDGRNATIALSPDLARSGGRVISGIRVLSML